MSEVVPTDKAVAVYDQFGLAYVEGQKAFDAKSSEPVREALKELSHKIIPERVVGDIGCGAGDDLLFYAALGAQQVVGIEPSKTMRDMALTTTLDEPSISVLNGNLENTGLDNFALDTAIARYSLHILTNLEPAFREMARVLKPDGTFVILVSHPDFDEYITTKRNVPVGSRIDITIFGGKVTLNNGTHSIEEYIGDAPQEYFTIDTIKEFCLSSNLPDLKTDLLVVYRKK